MSLFSKLKQIKDLREQAKTLQTQLSQETVHSQKGAVSVVMDGNFKIIQIEIDGREREDAKDAVNDAVGQVQKLLARKVQKGEIKAPQL